MKHHPLHRSRMVPWLVGLIAAAILTFGAMHTLGRARSRQQREFAAAAKATVHEFEAALDADIVMLSTIVGLFNASEEVTRQEFRTFVVPYFNRQHRDRQYQALGWVPRVPATERKIYQAAVRSQGFPQFQITERRRDGAVVSAAQREEYFPIGYLEPLAAHETLLGYDLASTPPCREALGRARDTAAAAATEPIILHDQTGSRNWLLVCTPIYQSKRTPSTVDERREQLQGFAVGVYHISDMLDAMLVSHVPREMSVAVFDGTTISAQSRLHGQVRLRMPLRAEQKVRVGRRDWLVVCQGTSDFGGRHQAALAWVSIVGGGILAVLVVTILLLLQARARQAEREAGRDHLILQTSMDGFLLVGLDGKVLDVNAAYCDMAGYSREELLSMRVSDLDANQSPEEIARHLQAVREAGSDRFEAQTRRKDGEIVDAEISTGLCQSPGNEFFVAFARDITDRKRAQEALRTSERRYRTLIENLPQKIFLKDRNSTYLSGNENYARDLGITPAELVGKVDYDFFPRELADKYRADDKRIMDAGETEDLEEKYVVAGEEFWVHTVKTPVRDDNGAVVAILGIFWDITESKRAQEALAASESQYRRLVEMLHDLVGEVDLEGRFTFISSASHEILGYPPAEVVGRSIVEMVPPEDVPAMTQQFRETVETGSPLTGYPWTVITADGSRRHLELNLRPIAGPDGHVSGLIGAARDITERVLAQRALERQNRRLEALNLIAAAAGSTFDIDNLAQRAIDAVVTVTGAVHGALHVYSPEDDALVMRARSGIPDMILPQELDRLPVGDDPGGPASAFRSGEVVVEDLRERVQCLAGSPLRNAVEMLLHGQGLPQMLFAPLLARGRSMGVVCLCYAEGNEVAADDLKCLEAAGAAIGVAIDNAMLYQANQQRAEELARANEELKSLDRMKNDFISLVGHELRTPLSGILGYAEFLLDEDLSPEEGHQFATIIHRESERLTRLVNAVLDLNKMEAGRIEYRKVAEDLNDIVRVAAASMESAAERRKQRLRLALAPEPLAAEFDPDRIQQVVLNLLSNAVKFSPENSEIEIGTRSDDGSVVAWVRDQGIGIAAEDMARVFERFVQADHGDKRLEGTGLGLPICKGIVEGGHAGEIWVESPGPGQGATFYFRIPRHAVDASSDR